MKIVLMVILISVIMIIAKAISSQFKDKYEFYYNLKLFLNEFKINLSFKHDKLNEFLTKTKASSSFSVFIKEYQSYLKTGEINLTKISFLDNEEIEFLEDIIKNIGKYDVKNEVLQIENFILLVEQKLTKAEKDKTSLCPMIIKLSFLFSIGLVIILIWWGN